jgi:hypothetical protein
MSAHDTHDLQAFAAAMAQQLPGTWNSSILTGAQAVADEVWDMNQVAAAIAEHTIDRCAVLTQDDGTRLYAIGRPGDTSEYLVAALAPRQVAPEAFRGVREPDGIAVPGDPYDAAVQVTVDLLPRYDAAVAELQHDAGHRSAQRTVTMTWLPDGRLSAVARDRRVADALTESGFVYDPAEQAYLLGDDDTAEQARCVRAAGTRLNTLGVGIKLRRAPAPATLTTTLLLPARPARTAAPTRS